MSDDKSVAAERARVKAEHDAVANRVNVSRAQGLRGIEAWVPTSAPDEQDDKMEVQTRNVTDTAGMGAVISQSARDEGPLADLKKRLLGKKAAGLARGRPGGLRAGAGLQIPGLGTLAPAEKKDLDSGSTKRYQVEQEDDDEEEGRASMIKSKRQKVTPKTSVHTHEDDDEETGRTSQARSRPARKGGSFLDELLSERAGKKKKKKSKS